jgi:ArsR family transcriptional regulator, arsenate/arsenite/antimonite-responsive transcriptional repressor
MEEQLKIFKSLSDQNRIRILKMLQGKTLCVCEITEVLKLANSTVSSHLSNLKESGLIIEKKEGKWINYSINPNPGNPVLASIIAMMNLWFENSDIVTTDRKNICCVDRDKLCKTKSK